MSGRRIAALGALVIGLAAPADLAADDVRYPGSETRHWPAASRSRNIVRDSTPGVSGTFTSASTRA